jgi:lysophospholipase L1-like esterase
MLSRLGPLLGALGAVLAVLAAVIVVLPPSPAAAAVPGESNGGVRIMPLGDSITDGYTPYPGGYRVNLWQRFVAGGYRVDFVGSQTNGPAELGDHDHEGHPGWRIDQLDANIVSWLNATDPRTILLHIGTNDINQNYDVANAPARLSTLIDHILQTKPNVQLFVAQIITEQGEPHATMIDNYNAAIPGIVASKGPNVHVVNMHAALTAADLADGVHPTQAGYNKMAPVWYDALQSVPASLQPLPGSRVVNAASNRCLDVKGAVTTAGTPTIIYDCHGSTNQSWTYTAAGEFRVYGADCLDAQGQATTDGTPVNIWPCNGQANQHWQINANGTITGVQSGKCLTPAGFGTANLTALQLQTCNGSTAQRWTVA